MSTLYLVEDDIKSDILNLVLDFIKINIVENDDSVAFPEIKYSQTISYEHNNKTYKEFFCSLYAIIDTYNCYSQFFCEDENKVSESEEFIFNLASDKFKLKPLDMKHLNDILRERSYIVSDKHASIVDIFYFCCVYKILKPMAAKEKVEYYHICRWYIHLQETLMCEFVKLHKLDIQSGVESLLNSRIVTSTNEKGNNEQMGSKKDKGNKKNADSKDNSGKNKKKNNNAENKDAEETRSLDDISRLNIVVGYVESVEIHSGADTLYCLKVNVGEDQVRDICSGLRNKKNPEDLLNKYVLVLANLKEKLLRGRKSFGMVLCGSFEERVELLVPPPGVKVGERITFENVNTTGLPDKTLSSVKEKNAFFLIQPNFVINNGVAFYKENKWLSSQGEITCALDQGTIS
ncbi:tRNA binding protein, putative [Plasmodium chabaudi adami]|uniref:tRNA binding protein, putative n=1 Tax=Plasmodium chabaudi adami TaxID=5826 RepID=A0A1C6XUA2_PLACE|nr:tRNA binding protein, putative [Plasmodium chabaudi adami]